MRCYFSGGTLDPLMLAPNRKPHLMVSFYDMTKRAQRRCVRSFLDQIEGVEDRWMGSLFFDSGAYAFQKRAIEYSLEKGKPFRNYCDRYAAFLKEMNEQTGPPDLFAANLDVIGDPELTWEIQMFFEQEHGLRPMPVIHLGTSMQYVERYLERGYEILGFGGFARNRNAKKKLAWCNEAFNLVCPKTKNRLPAVKIHGFGMFDFALITRFPWYSVDSTTWHQPATRGVVYMPKWSKEKNCWDFEVAYRKIDFSNRPSKQAKWRKGQPKPYLATSKSLRQEIENWLDHIQTDDFVLSELSEYRAEANLLYWKGFEDSRPRYPQRFLPLDTTPS